MSDRYFNCPDSMDSYVQLSNSSCPQCGTDILFHLIINHHNGACSFECLCGRRTEGKWNPKLNKFTVTKGADS